MSETENIGLGIILPSANSIIERDYPRLNLPGVNFHFTRVYNSEDNEEQLKAMKDTVGASAIILSHVRWMKAVGLGCTSGSFIGGMGYDNRLAEIMTEASGLPAITTSGSILAAMRLLGMKKLATFDPYPKWLSDIMTAFLASNGFAIVASHCDFGMGPCEGLDDFEPINDWIAPRVPAEADGVFIGCTNFSWLRGIAPLEERIGRPVMTSNLATLWRLLQVGGVELKDDLLSTRLAATSLVRSANTGRG